MTRRTGNNYSGARHSFAPKRRKPERPFCKARTRRQAEAASWGESQRGCGFYALPGSDYCRIHQDPDKRY